MGKEGIRICRWLLPLAGLYGLGVNLRNWLFDRGWLRSRSFAVPVICVGNLSAGGTGKTPHTEYLIRLLRQAGLNVATLSRGYLRHTKGYVLADATSDARQIGDEPCQMKSKFPDVQVAVDERRCHGIEQLLQLEPPVEAILLDDAFQHRYVKAGLNILLTDYHRLFCHDALLPAGRLREPARGKERAQVIIVTKCPAGLRPDDCADIARQLKLHPRQQLFFTCLQYGTLQPLFPEKARTRTQLPEAPQVLLLTGIASPARLIEEVRSHLKSEKELDVMAFGDHHDFNERDFRQVCERFRQLEQERRLIITTEKDAARLRSHPGLPEELKPSLYMLPIEIKFLRDQQDIFNQIITGYVKTNSRNGSLSEG